MKYLNYKLLLAGSLLASPLVATAASYDCMKAATQIEKSICANATLSKLDDALSIAYRAAKGSSTDLERLQTDQMEWVRTRNACKNDECIQNSYENRLNQLQGPTKKDGELKKSAQKSKYEQGKDAFDKKDYVQSFSLFNEAVAEGDFDAEHILGFLYVSGQGTTKDLKKGIQLIEQSVKRGNPKGMFTLGQLYYNGAFGVQKDQKRGLELLQDSAKKGNEKAQAELQKIGVKSEAGNPISSNIETSDCPPLDKNPGLQNVDNSAKAVTSKDGLSKFIKNTCDELKDQLRSTVYRKGEVPKFMMCFFSKNELASMLKIRTYEAGITHTEAINMINDRCPSFYAKRYDPYYVAIQDQQNRAAAQKEAEKEEGIRKAEQAKKDQIVAAKAAEEAKQKRAAEERSKMDNLRTNAAEKSGVTEKSRIVWMRSKFDIVSDAATYIENYQKNTLEDIVIGDQMKLSGKFSFTPPLKGEFEKTEEYNLRVEKARLAWNAEHPGDQRMKRLEVLFVEYLGVPMIKELKYNADKETFNFVVAGHRNNSISIPVAMQIPRKDAEAAKDKLSGLLPIVIFELKGDQLFARYIKFYYPDYSAETEIRPVYTAALRFNESEAKRIEASRKDEEAKRAAQAKKSPPSKRSVDPIDYAVQKLGASSNPMCAAYARQIDMLMPNRAMYESRIWDVLGNADRAGCL